MASESEGTWLGVDGRDPEAGELPCPVTGEAAPVACANLLGLDGEVLLLTCVEGPETGILWPDDEGVLFSTSDSPSSVLLPVTDEAAEPALPEDGELP